MFIHEVFLSNTDIYEEKLYILWINQNIALLIY